MSQDRDRDRQQREFRDGLRNVTQATLEALADVGIVATAEQITCDPPWEPGRAIPEAIEIHVRPEGAPFVRAPFSREDIEDSWRTIERPLVRQRIRAIAAEYARLRGALRDANR